MRNIFKKTYDLMERLVRFTARLIGVAELAVGIFIYATSGSILGLGVCGFLAITTFFRWWPIMGVIAALSVVAVIAWNESLFAIVAVTYATIALFGAIASKKHTEARVARRLARKAARTNN